MRRPYNHSIVCLQKDAPLITVNINENESHPSLTMTPSLQFIDGALLIVDQRRLPDSVRMRRLTSAADAADAITRMCVRGAPLIGITAAYGLYFALRENASDAALATASVLLNGARPTAVNLQAALTRVTNAIQPLPLNERAAAALHVAHALATEDADLNRRIGEHGLHLLRACPRRTPDVLNVLTHCNAGRIATVAHGTALAPVYAAHAAGLPVHVWVSETRPRNQGLLTAYELADAGVPYTLIVDNAAGALLRGGQVDVCLVGADRVTHNGDVCNKIGTYLKAVAAHDCGVPFYAAFAHTTFDADTLTGDNIIIEERASAEVYAAAPEAAFVPPIFNPGFDVTPARLITGYLTEHGCAADIASVYA